MHLFGRLVLVCVFAGLYPATCRAADAPRSVLILDQSGPGLQGSIDISAALRSTLSTARSGEIVVYSENLDLTYFAGPRHTQILKTFIREKYLDTPIRLVVALGPAALEFALQLRTDAWSDLPIVFAAVEDARPDHHEPANVTGRTIKFLFANSIHAARIAVPNLDTIAMVGDTLDTQQFRRHFILQLPEAVAGLTLIDLMGLPLRDVKQRVATLPDTAAVIYTTMTTDGEGRRYFPNDALAAVADVANRPIVVDVDNRVGYGAVGGLVVVPSMVGQDVGRLALRILNGESPSQIPIEAMSAVQPIFDWRQLKRWNIDVASLPPGSQILYRTPSAWEQYRWQIMLGATALLLQAGLICVLVLEHWRRRGAETQTLQLMTQFAQANRIATAGQLSASIAHEIRQPLAAIVTYGNAGMRWLQASPPDMTEVQTTLRNIVDEGHRADQIIKEIRALFKHDVGNREPLDVNALIDETLNLVDHEIRKHGVATGTTLCSAPVPWIMGDKIQLQQVMLNLIRNAVEAMNAPTCATRELNVSSHVAGRSVVIRVADTGPGIDPKNRPKIFDAFFTTKAGGMGIGLSICQTIVEAHDGKLTVAPSGYRGSTFEIVLPLYRPEDVQ